MTAKRLTRNALLIGIALIIFTFEVNLPPLTPIPGIKLGLSNIITIYAVFALSPMDAFLILGSRILLGALITGNISALMYSAAGGFLCFLSMLGLRHILSAKQIWIASVIGAAMHNLGQILVAVIVAQTPALFAYLPILIAAGMVAGLFTGFCGQFLIERFHTSAN